MEKINLFKNLIRLSVIAEEIQETHPEAAKLIDSTISDAAEMTPDKGREEFPPISTPYSSQMDTSEPGMGGEVDQIAHTVIDDLKQNPDFQHIIEKVKNGVDSPETLNHFVSQKIHDMLNANNQAY